MDGNKLIISGKADEQPPPASYKAIPEADMDEEEVTTRPKSLLKSNPATPEADGAHEKMLPDEDSKVALNSKIDIGDVKITSNERQNGDAKLDIGDLKSAYIGMGKEELMKYANDPFWVRLRWFLFILFWLLWAAMLVGAVVIIYVAPKCDPPKTWWEQGPLTEVKSDVTAEELKALKKQNIQGVIVEWPEDTYADFPDDHAFFDKLNATKTLGLNVIVDLKPAVSTLWFEKSEQKVDGFDEYYVWRAPNGTDVSGTPVLPNNWKIVKNEPAWKYSNARKEFHYLAPDGEPLLNFRNPKVVEAFSKVIQRFVDKGVDGVRLKHAPFLLVDDKFTDEYISNIPGLDLNDYDFNVHSKTRDHPELAPLLQKWRKIVKSKIENGAFMISDEFNVIKVGSYSVDNKLLIDLPVQSYVFNQPILNVTRIVQNLNASLATNITWWPLRTHETEAVPSDVLDIVTLLMPGTVLVKNGSVIDPELQKLRQSLMMGSFNFTEIANRTGLAYIRVVSGHPGLLVALNPTNSTINVNFVKEIPAVSEEVTVQVMSSNFNETDFTLHSKQSASNIPISPRSSIVFSYVPKKDD